MNLPYVTDKILYAILNQISKAFQLKLTWSEKVVSGTVGDYTTVDEALTLAQAETPTSLRVSLNADIESTTAVAEPTVAEGEVIFWFDTTNSKYYQILGTAAGNKKVELV